jgi:hypothetical protein
MHAVWLRLRADVRHRWPGVVGVGLLVGLAGAVVLTAAAGATNPDRRMFRDVDRPRVIRGRMPHLDRADEIVISDVAARPGWGPQATAEDLRACRRGADRQRVEERVMHRMLLPATRAGRTRPALDLRTE